jgi:hypothetical protein
MLPGRIEGPSHFPAPLFNRSFTAFEGYQWMTIVSFLQY